MGNPTDHETIPALLQNNQFEGCLEITRCVKSCRKQKVVLLPLFLLTPFRVAVGVIIQGPFPMVKWQCIPFQIFHYISFHSVQTCQNKENKNRSELTKSDLHIENVLECILAFQNIFIQKHFIKKNHSYIQELSVVSSWIKSFYIEQ